MKKLVFHNQLQDSVAVWKGRLAAERLCYEAYNPWKVHALGSFFSVTYTPRAQRYFPVMVTAYGKVTVNETGTHAVFYLFKGLLEPSFPLFCYVFTFFCILIIRPRAERRNRPCVSSACAAAVCDNSSAVYLVGHHVFVHWPGKRGLYGI